MPQEQDVASAEPERISTQQLADLVATLVASLPAVQWHLSGTDRDVVGYLTDLSIHITPGRTENGHTPRYRVKLFIEECLWGEATGRHITEVLSEALQQARNILLERCVNPLEEAIETLERSRNG